MEALKNAGKSARCTRPTATWPFYNRRQINGADILRFMGRTSFGILAGAFRLACRKVHIKRIKTNLTRVLDRAT